MEVSETLPPLQVAELLWGLALLIRKNPCHVASIQEANILSPNWFATNVGGRVLKVGSFFEENCLAAPARVRKMKNDSSL